MTFQNGISVRCFRFETKVRPVLEIRTPLRRGSPMNAVIDSGLDNRGSILGKKNRFIFATSYLPFLGAQSTFKLASSVFSPGGRVVGA